MRQRRADHPEAQDGQHGTAAIDDNDTPEDPSDDMIVYTPDEGFSGVDAIGYVLLFECFFAACRDFMAILTTDFTDGTDKTLAKWRTRHGSVLPTELIRLIRVIRGSFFHCAFTSFLALAVVPDGDRIVADALRRQGRVKWRVGRLAPQHSLALRQLLPRQ